VCHGAGRPVGPAADSTGSGWPAAGTVRHRRPTVTTARSRPTGPASRRRRRNRRRVAGAAGSG